MCVFNRTASISGSKKIDVVFTDLVFAEHLKRGISSEFFTALAQDEAQRQLIVFSIPANCALYDIKANLALLGVPAFAARFTP